jgi:ketosteroid isomerase-like protein
MTVNTEAIIAEINAHLAAENAQDLDTLLEGMTDDCFNLIVPDPHQLTLARPKWRAVTVGCGRRSPT